MPHRMGATDLKIMPPRIKQANITKDGVSTLRMSSRVLVKF